MEHLQTIRYWIIVGSCLLGAATTLFCLGAWFYTSPRWRALFATLDRQFRSLPPFGKLVAIVKLHVSSSGTLSFGWPKGSPRARELPDGSGLDFLAPLQTAIGIAPPAGRFWHAPTLSNSLLLTWQDVHSNRNTNFPVSFQSELYANGDFTFRYDFSSLKPQASSLPTTNFVVGAQHNGGGETYAFGDTNRLVNGLELRWRAFGLLDPDKDDHDDDGLSTYDEVMIHGTDPRLADSDHDGIDDPDELVVGTDPRNPDADGDGLADGFDPQPFVWNDPDADADNDGYPLWQELLYGTSDAVPGDVAQLLADGARSVTFTISGTPGPGTVLTLAGYPLLLAGRTTFSLDLADGSVIPLALDNAPGVSVAVTSPDCIALTGGTGGLAPGGTGAGTAILVLPVITIGSNGTICLHAVNQTIAATVTAYLPGIYDWVWDGGGNFGGHSPVISSAGIPPGGITVAFWPDDGNGGCSEASATVNQCRRIYCEHGLPACECGLCTGGSSEAWCSLHDQWKCLCACLTMGGGGMLASGAETVCTVGDENDTCVNHAHQIPCCDCPEHAGWSWPEAKTNVMSQISSRLDVRLDGVAVGVGQKLSEPTPLTVKGAQLSAAFNDARIVASHEMHPSDTVTSSWTVAAIGLEPATYTAGRYPIRGGTSCVSRVSVLTDSALAEGSLRLDAGSGGLRFSATEVAPWADAQALRNDTPPASVGASRDFWLGASTGGSHTLEYSLRTPQGAACLSTNLAIEAIVAKFATNVYYAAYCQTNGILVGLSSASHDPAGYTLRLGGSLCATGQPPWQVAVSNLAAGAHTLTVQSKTFPDLADEVALYIIKISLVPDYDRDGVIGALDKARAATNEVFRFWINDDKDVGDTAQDGGSDIPGQESNPDHADFSVNGRRDLADLFPVLVDIGTPVPGAGTPAYYRLRQTGGAVSFVYTSLGDLNANWHLTRDIAGCGAGLNMPLLSATVIPVPTGGIALSGSFVQWMGLTGGHGVILVEGAAASSEPLVLDAVMADGTVAASGVLPMRIAPVEQMYTRVNLRDDPAVVTTGSALPPDSGKNVVFLHGFNVNQDDARGWHAETFKRLWRTGSNARFHAVTWRGDIGIVNAFHYHENVVSAFETAPRLKSYIDGIPEGRIVIAHSLGCMVAASAIADHGTEAGKFLMINAAVASECFDASLWSDSPAPSNDMVHDDWAAYTNACWSAKWHELFAASPSDDRRLLTWKERLGGVPGDTALYNFYSTGDEVFELRATTPDVVSGLSSSLGRYAWHKQETLKGRGTETLVGTSWAGWGFERAFTYQMPCVTSTWSAVAGPGFKISHNGAYPPPEVQTESVLLAELDAHPVFRRNPSSMFTNAIPAAARNEILAKGIPALSPSAGIVAILDEYNAFDMNIDFKPDGGVWGRVHEDYGKRWLHNNERVSRASAR